MSRTADPNILVQVEVLFTDGAATPRPLEAAAIALERLSWLGAPVVVVGGEIGGRALPEDCDARHAWVRSQLAMPDLRVVAVPDRVPGARAGDPADRSASDRWRVLAAEWHAGHLITSDPSWVGAARRAGLVVTRVGPRAVSDDPRLPRADHEALDLLDAVRRLIASDAFGEPHYDAASVPGMVPDAPAADR